MNKINKEELLLIEHEGLELKPYIDTAGKVTLGIGRNITDVGISNDEAYLLMRNDIKRCSGELGSFSMLLGGGAREAALRNMLFNLGLPRFKGFKKMLAALSVFKYDVAAEEMLDSKWARQVGNRAAVLAKMVETDTWT